MEAWLPLVDTLLGTLASKVPAPKAPGANSIFYAARCLESADGQYLAFGRHVTALPGIAANLPQVTASPAATSWFLNGPTGIPLTSLKAAQGAMLAVPVDSPPLGVAVTVRCVQWTAFVQNVDESGLSVGLFKKKVFSFLCFKTSFLSGSPYNNPELPRKVHNNRELSSIMIQSYWSRFEERLAMTARQYLWKRK